MFFRDYVIKKGGVYGTRVQSDSDFPTDRVGRSHIIYHIAVYWNVDEDTLKEMDDIWNEYISVDDHAGYWRVMGA